MADLLSELEWLKKNPAFEQRPATIREFLGPDYLNIDDKVRERIRDELVAIMGEEVDPLRVSKYHEAVVTGGIGIGKTTIASIVLPYLVHWVLCLKDPQDFYGLMAGSRIAFMQMSTSEKQALEVVFGDIKARIAHSPWFRAHYQPDPAYRNQIRFAKDIWIIPGDSQETTFEGYNILGGILDEGDSHKVTQTKDYAEQGYTTISSRISSRFQDRGFLLVIGQMKKATGFMARKYDEFSGRRDAYAVRLAIWDSMGKKFYVDKDGGKTFSYDTFRKLILPGGVAPIVKSAHVIEVPELYRRQFESNPEKALRDLAGIPPKVGNPFISLVDRIHECRDRWVNNYGDQSPVSPDGRIERWFKASDGLKRVAHIDIAYSAKGDALGFAMGHVRELVEVDDELKPVITIDLLLRWKAAPGTEIMLSDVRRMIYSIRDDRRFRLDKVTFDGFQSTDTKQQLEKHRFEVELVSVDRSVLPYSDVRDAIYEKRMEFPPYVVQIEQNGMMLEEEIAIRELSELVDLGNKVDHPEQGSKDVADAIAGVTYILMGDRRYHRKVRSLNDFRESKGLAAASGGSRFEHHAYVGDQKLGGPPRLQLPPNWR
jgi:hypothetical protein